MFLTLSCRSNAPLETKPSVPMLHRTADQFHPRAHRPLPVQHGVQVHQHLLLHRLRHTVHNLFMDPLSLHRHFPVRVSRLPVRQSRDWRIRHETVARYHRIVHRALHMGGHLRLHSSRALADSETIHIELKRRKHREHVRCANARSAPSSGSRSPYMQSSRGALSDRSTTRSDSAVSLFFFFFLWKHVSDTYACCERPYAARQAAMPCENASSAMFRHYSLRLVWDVSLERLRIATVRQRQQVISLHRHKGSTQVPPDMPHLSTLIRESNSRLA